MSRAPSKETGEAVEIESSQIERITLTPNAEGGLEIHLYGDLARILWFREEGSSKSKRPGTGVPGREVSLVAGARVGRCFPLISARGLERTMPHRGSRVV